MNPRPAVHDNSPNSLDPDTLDGDDLVVFIGILTDRLKVHEEAADHIRAARARAFRSGRTRDPKVIQKRMAIAAGGMSEAGVIAAIDKLNTREAEEAAR